MRKAKIIIIIACVFWYIDHASDKLVDSTNMKFQQTDIVHNYITYLESKIEKIGDNSNKMELYEVKENIDVSVLKEFCLEKKLRLKRENYLFSYVVFFDNKENAVFPKNPLTGGFSQEDVSRHIKAIFTFNSLNGFSKLGYYEKNKWESKSQEIEI